MSCPGCGTAVPAVAHFCHHCGRDLRTDDADRRRSFAARPDEPVASFALISTIMPRGVGRRPQTYRIALTVALVAALLAAIFGALPIAVLVAAFAIPIVYIVYLYDVNLWKDEPLPVTALAFVLTAVLGIGFTVVWLRLRGADLAIGAYGAGGMSPTLGGFLVTALLVPVLGEAIRQIGPVMLASRPRFDDLMDGLTFGVISGVAYATADTLVKHWSLLTGGMVSLDDPGLWVSLIFLEGFVKPVVIGTATGIACAEFSGLGRGYDGFTLRYLRGAALAVAANVLYFGGSYLLSFAGNATFATFLTLIWGVLIAGALIIRLRTVLHVGLMEAALERTARDGLAADPGLGGADELDFCAQCEMPLLEHAAFCNACGTSVRVQTRTGRGTAQPIGAAATPIVATAGVSGTAAAEHSIATPAVRDRRPAPLPPPSKDPSSPADEEGRS